MKALMKEAARHRPCDVQYVQYYTVFPDRSWNYYLRATYELRARDGRFYLFSLRWGARNCACVHVRHASVGLAVSIILILSTQ